MLPAETKGRTLLIVDDEYFLAGEVTRDVQVIGVKVMDRFLEFWRLSNCSQSDPRLMVPSCTSG